MLFSLLPRAISFRRLLLLSSDAVDPKVIRRAAEVSEQSSRPFGKSQVVASLYRFVESHELKKALDQFCEDLGLQDELSVTTMAQSRVLNTSLRHFWAHRDYFKPHPQRDAMGQAAADFMAAQTLVSLFETGAVVDGTPIEVPLVSAVMRRGAEGLFKVGRRQFEELAQMAVDLVEWLARNDFRRVALVEAPLGNSVPVAVLDRLARQRGLGCEVVEWGCPRNDRALDGQTVKDSAADLASRPRIAAADIVLFVDDAITGSRFLKMVTALRAAVGSDRVAAVAMRVRYNPLAGLKEGQLRDLSKVDRWAEALKLPYGELGFPDLPLFCVDDGKPALFQSALAWGDASITAGKRKANLVFYFLDRYEAIVRDLGQSEESVARDLLTNSLWARDTSGQEVITLPSIAKDVFTQAIDALPDAFFDQIRENAKIAFPTDFYGRRVAGTEAVRARTDWLADCVYNEAVLTLPPDEAKLLNYAVQTLSAAEFDAGISAPPRDHNYGLGTFPLPQGEDALHLHLVDLILAEARTKTPRDRAPNR